MLTGQGVLIHQNYVQIPLRQLADRNDKRKYQGQIGIGAGSTSLQFPTNKRINLSF